jgi:amidophosphoribosyltransferase
MFVDRALNESCGVFGLLSRDNLPLGRIMYYGLYALQHRGQESAGMAVFDHDQLRLHKEMGLVNQVFTEGILDRLVGQVGIGHTRYSTAGGSSLQNAQPVVARTSLGAVTLAHNGNLINVPALRAFLTQAGYIPNGDSDSHLMVEAIRYELDQALAHKGETTVSLLDAVEKALARCEGAFCVVIATGDSLIAARDGHGLRPLSLGRTEENYPVVASETCALDIVGATFERDIAPGELFLMHLDGTTQQRFMTGPRNDHLCVFELVYFARPDSRIRNISVYNYRLELGRRLAALAPVPADIVIPVPDSGNVAAVGYSRASGIPYVEGLIKNRYVGRTFIHPTQALREQGIKLKLNPMTDVLAGKRVVVVDDSIVRGNTSRKLVAMLRDCGVQEIHLRISSAPVRHPCFYGIDMSEREELLAHHLSEPEIAKWLEVDSLAYLSEADMALVAGNAQACRACFSGQYPAGVPEDA